MRKAIVILFNLIVIFVPLIFYIRTSEVFEFNKMVAVYALTTVIVTLWIIRMILNGKILFRRTMVDIPLLIFLGAQIVSTLFSIDVKTSILGYYSRFNGGLASTLAYCLLYWAYVSNIDREETKKIIRNLLLAAGIVSIYGILEHFGASISCIIVTGQFNNTCWVQDVTTRVFATLGQPNWMAAYLVALVPLSFTLAFQSEKSHLKIFYSVLGLTFVLAILFTKSRSGLLGLAVSYAFFLAMTVFIFRKNLFKSLKTNFVKLLSPLLISALLTLGAVTVFGSPWTPSAIDLITQKPDNTAATETQSLEGGTESGDIRKIVWKGAVNIWKAYPLIGSGPETFAFSYYRFRPIEHNLVSEWDFLYNKAHNEYLNFAANSGILGLLSYLALIASFLLLIFKSATKDKDEPRDAILKISMASGLSSILITNFFGFSVVVTELLFFLIPAIVVSLAVSKQEDNYKPVKTSRKLIIVGVTTAGLYLLFIIFNYWQADTLYASAKAEIELGNASNAIVELTHAVKKTPWEPLYHDKLAQVYSAAAVANSQSEKPDVELGRQLELYAVYETEHAVELSPQNFVILQDRINVYSDLAKVDKNYYTKVITLLGSLITHAPNYAKTYYKLALTHIALGQQEKAKDYLKKAIELKTNYIEAKDLLTKLENQ